jgi:hypothetical protein
MARIELSVSRFAIPDQVRDDEEGRDRFRAKPAIHHCSNEKGRRVAAAPFFESGSRTGDGST